ncbi:hypothetical protein GYMLUDRAFT_841546 [Collybiopsis luxurians FD-317 M1]|uniref:F-box domain-containing protein n=1 Tax=Collybiopsis luxurians FD-317 M1 TaxID=944289 RepID=A0A0D0CBA0_9AGAR|nr:hypothetical protein GYMLUDRAFT_841546 [Collybiopsis luxurians FD-317 M1]
MAVELPFEIWWKIFQYLPSDECVIRLRTVNRLFLEIARILLYRKLSINKYEKRTKNLLKGISSLSLGHHIRSLCIQPWAVSSASHHRGPVGRFLSTSDRVRSFVDSDYPERKAKNLFKKRIHKQTRLVARTVRKLEHVQEYTVAWETKKSSQAPAELFTVFLALLNISSFSRTLKILTLRVPTDRLVCLVPVRLPALEELNIHLVTESLSETFINDCLEKVIVFINNHLETLETLSFFSTDLSRNLNLSKFFRSLSTLHFLHLHSFALSLPYDSSHLPDETSSLTDFLRNSETVHQLKFSVYPCSSSRPSDILSEYQIQRVLTTQELVNALVSLNTLELSVQLVLGDLKPLLAFISSVARRLKSLTLTGELSPPTEIERVLSAVAPAPTRPSTSLRHLSICLEYLSPTMLNLLASRLPFLKSLKLTFNHLRSSSHPNENSSQDRRSRDHTAMFRTQLLYDSSQGRYAQWNLSLLEKCLPSLVDFRFLEWDVLLSQP